MNRRLLALVVVLLFTVAGVRIVDPTFSNEKVAIAFDDDPAVIAADSVRNMQSKKVTTKLQIIVDSGPQNETHRKRTEIRAEHDIQRYYTVHSTDNDSDWELGFFGTDGMGWTKSPYTDWGRAPSSRYPGFGTVMDPAAMEESTVEVLADNATMFVVRFEGEDANKAVEGLDAHTKEALLGHLDLYIDKQRGLPVRAIRAYKIPERNTTVSIRYQFTRYGKTTVKRPDGVPKISVWELLGDIYYD